MKCIIPTSQRPDKLAALLPLLSGFEIEIWVNNTPPDQIEAYKAISLPDNCKMIVVGITGVGTVCHNQLMSRILPLQQDAFLVIEDDVKPMDNFLEELQFRLEVIPDLAFTLSPIYLPHRNSDFYTSRQSKPVQFGNYKFIDQGWVDGNFYASRAAAKYIARRFLDKVPVFKTSSGVGRAISQAVPKLYTAVPTMVEHLDHDSIQFPEGRKRVPLVARFGQF
jgi:hypothetical protein